MFATNAIDKYVVSSMKISSRQIIPWHLQVLTRMKSHLFLKTFGITLFMSAFFTGYFYLLNNPVFPVTVMPVTALDIAVGFKPATLFLYASLWLYVSLPPALQATRGELIYYGWAVGGLCVAGLSCFLLWPTAVPSANIDWEQGYGFSILKGVDAAGNACPSLHVATAVFSAMWLNRQLFEVGAPRIFRVLNWAWCAGIAYSTLATKQHVAVDMFAGVMLGMCAAFLSLTQSSFSSRQSRVPVEIDGQQQQ
ncbi:MAG: phosphatase PAP2 family protein [Burkholderiales bacterium]